MIHHHHKEIGIHGTPIKRKNNVIVQMGTAESDSKIVHGIEDIQPKDLLENFDHIVNIIKEDPEREEEETQIERKL